MHRLQGKRPAPGVKKPGGAGRPRVASGIRLCPAAYAACRAARTAEESFSQAASKAAGISPAGSTGAERLIRLGPRRCVRTSMPSRISPPPAGRGGRRP